MDVNDIKITMLQLPHRLAEGLNSEQDRLMSAINAIRTENARAAASLPPLHTLLSRLDAVQGAQELEDAAHEQKPAFEVDLNSGQMLRLLDQDAFQLDLQYNA